MAEKQQLGKRAAPGSGASVGKAKLQPEGNIFELDTGRPIRVRKARKQSTKGLEQIAIEYFGHAVVDGKGGRKEVVDVFDERHPSNSRNMKKGGSTAQVQDFFSKHRDDHGIGEEVYS